jgi:xanthine/uracil permease
MTVAHYALTAVLRPQFPMLGEEIRDLGLNRLRKQAARSLPEDFGELVVEGSWLNQFDNVIVGHGISLLKWRSGGVKHPHDMPPSRFGPSPTFGDSSTFGTNTPFFAKPVTLVLLFGSVVLIIVLSQLGRGLVRLLSLFLTLVCAYVAAVPLGLANFDPIFAAPWFRIPALAPYGLEWPDAAGLIGVLVIMLVAAVEATSLALAVCDIVGIPSTERHIIGVVSADGLCSAISAIFGGIPLVSYTQNFGALTLTGVGSRFAVAAGGAILVLMAFVPKIGAILTIVPPFVIGGTLIFTFGMIVSVGIGILAGSMKGQRDAVLVAASIATSAAATFMPPQVVELITPSLRIVLADGVVMGIITAFLLNLVMTRLDATK